ncbi:MAG: OmpL47-type beta-barrel domain-containing protein [Brevinema sp.]
MKNLWIVLPAFVAVNIFAQATNQAAAPVAAAAPTNTVVLIGTVGYTYTKDDVLYASPLAQFQVQGMDDQSGLDQIFVSLDENGYAPYRGPISFTEEGPHTLSYKFVDKVGNISYSQLFNIYIDASAPRVLEPVFNPPVFKASGRNYVGPTNSITFKHFDDLVGTASISYAADSNTMNTYADAFTPNALGLTTNTAFLLVYQAVDAVSNLTPVKNMPLYLDAVAPVVNVFAKVFELNGIRYISSKEVIYVEAFDADTEVKEILYAINDGEFAVYDPQIGIRITAAGEYDVKAVATDIVGNVSDEVLYSVVVDTLPPSGDASYLGVGVAATQANIPAQGGQTGAIQPTPRGADTAVPANSAAQTNVTPATTPVPNQQATTNAAPQQVPQVATPAGTTPASQEVPAGTTAPAAN